MEREEKEQGKPRAMLKGNPKESAIGAAKGGRSPTIAARGRLTPKNKDGVAKRQEHQWWSRASLRLPMHKLMDQPFQNGCSRCLAGNPDVVLQRSSLEVRHLEIRFEQHRSIGELSAVKRQQGPKQSRQDKESRRQEYCAASSKAVRAPTENIEFGPCIQNAPSICPQTA